MTTPTDLNGHDSDERGSRGNAGGGSGSVNQGTRWRRAERHTSKQRGRNVLRALGLGLVTGAADDDCSAIGTFAAAGAKLGTSFLWTVPATFPMMCSVVYLSSKLGQVSGRGLFEVIREHYPRWFVFPLLSLILLGNTIEAGANLGAMGAAVNVLLPDVPYRMVVVAIGLAILALQVWGSCTQIRNVFRWLALSLLGYGGAAWLARPDFGAVLKGTFVPTIRFDSESLSMLVAVMGATLSAYLYTWQSNQEVEEEMAMGRTELWQRVGATDAELRSSRLDIALGMLFSNLIMYCIILSTESTLHRSGHTEVESAIDEARALEPVAGKTASWLFALGMLAVGFLAVPVMTTGAAYDVAQIFGWRHGLSEKPKAAKAFYSTVGVFTAIGVAFCMFGLNPMRMLVWAGIAQGFTTPPLILLILILTNRRDIMGNRVNGYAANILGGVTTLLLAFATTLSLIVAWMA